LKNFGKNFWRPPSFPAVGNIYDYLPLGEEFQVETHFIMKAVAQWHVERALLALKFDIENDPNMKKDHKDNIGTAGRVVKVWGGAHLDPENIREYGEGRFTHPPRLAAFPNPQPSLEVNNPVIVKIDNAGLGSVCSHHLLPYNIMPDGHSRIIIAYIPEKIVLGLSKIGRFVEWCMNRPSLQEEMTVLIHQKIMTAAETEHIFVSLQNLAHTCEITRGAKHYSTTTTERYSGKFKDAGLRREVLESVH
jgi:GTP cyclohydrolase I